MGGLGFRTFDLSSACLESSSFGFGEVIRLNALARSRSSSSDCLLKDVHDASCFLHHGHVMDFRVAKIAF